MISQKEVLEVKRELLKEDEERYKNKLSFQRDTLVWGKRRKSDEWVEMSHIKEKIENDPDKRYIIVGTFVDIFMFDSNRDNRSLWVEYRDYSTNKKEVENVSIVCPTVSTRPQRNQEAKVYL